MSGGGRRRPPYRHSRVSGNPDGTEKTSPLPSNRRRIPAYAGMTVGRPPPLYRRDSRLRGNDGGGAVNHLSIQTQQILSILSIHV